MKCEYCDNDVPVGSMRCPCCGAAIACPVPQVNQQPVIVVQQTAASTQQSTSTTDMQQSAYLLANQKSRAAYIVIGFLFGEFGIHDFYAGYTGRGIAQLLITILSFGLLFWVSWIWAVVEMLTVEKDAKGIPFK